MSVMRVAGLVLGIGVGGIALFLYSAFGAFLPWRERAEAERLGGLAGIGAGQTVAEVGAGSGRLTEWLARRVGPDGRVLSTEIDAGSRDRIRERIEAAGLRNVSIVEAGSTHTNLPDGCCDVVLLRNVYHHIGDPDAFARSLHRAVRPGGRLVLIDFEPGSLWFHGGRPDGASDRRAGHGVDRAHVKREMAGAGFALEREIADWNGPMWLMMFRAPAPPQA